MNGMGNRSYVRLCGVCICVGLESDRKLHVVECGLRVFEEYARIIATLKKNSHQSLFLHALRLETVTYRNDYAKHQSAGRRERCHSC